MAFNLSRREQECLQIGSVIIRITKIRETSVTLRIEAPHSVRVRYKDFTRRAEGDGNTAQDRAQLITIKGLSHGPNTARSGHSSDSVD